MNPKLLRSLALLIYIDISVQKRVGLHNFYFSENLINFHRKLVPKNRNSEKNDFSGHCFVSGRCLSVRCLFICVIVYLCTVHMNNLMNKKMGCFMPSRLHFRQKQLHVCI